MATLARAARELGGIAVLSAKRGAVTSWASVQHQMQQSSTCSGDVRAPLCTDPLRTNSGNGPQLRGRDRSHVSHGPYLTHTPFSLSFSFLLSLSFASLLLRFTHTHIRTISLSLSLSLSHCHDLCRSLGRRGLLRRARLVSRQGHRRCKSHWRSSRHRGDEFGQRLEDDAVGEAERCRRGCRDRLHEDGDEHGRRGGLDEVLVRVAV